MLHTHKRKVQAIYQYQMEKNTKMATCKMADITKSQLDFLDSTQEDMDGFLPWIDAETDSVVSIPETASTDLESPSPQLLFCELQGRCTSPIEIEDEELDQLDAFDTSFYHQPNVVESIGAEIIGDFDSISRCWKKPARTKEMYSSTRDECQRSPLVPSRDWTYSGCKVETGSEQCDNADWIKCLEKAAHPPTRQQLSQDNAVPTAQVAGTKLSAFTQHQPKTIRRKRDSSTVQNGAVPPTKRPRHLEHQEHTSRVIDCKYVQYIDCKSKTASTKTRHEDLQSNILPNAADKYHRPIQIVRYKDGSRQPQTPCPCGRTRTFLRTRAIRKGVAITFFKAAKCTCGLEQTHQLLMCFCGALFQSTKSLYACPCFNRQGPALDIFPNYSEFAARRCPCPVEPRRRCRCMSTVSL